MNRPGDESAESTSSPEISIVIVAYKCLQHLQKLLASIDVHPSRREYEIIIVDNASHDGTAEWCLGAPLDIRLIVNEQNEGFAAAANKGAAMARGQYLLFCNPDMRWTSSVADVLLDWLIQDPRYGAASGRMTFPDGHFQPTCRRFPTFSNLLFSRGSLLAPHLRAFGFSTEYTLPDYDRPTEVESAAGTCMMISVKVFADLHGFDEQFFMYAEDTDLCRRLYQSGYTVWFIPEATAIHYWRGSSTESKTLIRHHTRSLSRYFRKHYPHAWIRNLLLTFLLAVRRYVGGHWGRS